MSNSLLTALNRLISVGMIAISLASVLPTNTVNAQGSYYGGMVVSTFVCSCTSSTLIIINDYASGGTKNLLYTPGASRIFDNNNVMNVGGYLLGSYSQGNQCLYYVGEGCGEYQTDGVLDSMPGTGTS